MTITIDSQYPYDASIPTLPLNESDYVYASTQSLGGYGRFFGQEAPPSIEQIPYSDPDPRSWRAPDKGTGLNQAVIQGEFTSCFKEDTLSVEATNLAVKSKQAENADYTIGWQAAWDPDTMRVVEFNNHKDAGQQFILKKGDASLFLLATAPEGTCPNKLSPKRVHADNIDPLTDLIVVALKQGESIEVGPGVYHQPLYPIDRKHEVMAYSIQGSIHNCTTCNFVTELGFDVGLSLRLPQAHSSSDVRLKRFLQQYALFTLSAGALTQSQLDNDDKTKRHTLYKQLQGKLVSTSLYEACDNPTPVSIQHLQSIIASLSLKQDDYYLASLLSERINWLFSTGRFLRNGKVNFLYAPDMFAISTILDIISHQTIEALSQGIKYASSLYLSTQSPYQRVVNQIILLEKLSHKAYELK